VAIKARGREKSTRFTVAFTVMQPKDMGYGRFELILLPFLEYFCFVLKKKNPLAIKALSDFIQSPLF